MDRIILNRIQLNIIATRLGASGPMHSTVAIETVENLENNTVCVSIAGQPDFFVNNLGQKFETS